MNRRNRNAICAALLIIALAAAGATMAYAVTHSHNNMDRPEMAMNQPPGQNSSGEQESGTPQDKQQTDESEGDSAWNTEQPPEMPQGEEPPAKPEGDSAAPQGEQPPDKPEGEEPPAKPDEDSSSQDEQKSEAAQDAEPPEMPQGNPLGESVAAKLSTGYYIALGAESFLAVSIILLLIMTSGNRKELREILLRRRNIVIMAGVIIIASAALTAGTAYVLEHYIIGDSSVPGQPGQPGQPGGSQNVEYDAVIDITEAGSLQGEDISSDTADQNAILITEANYGISKSKINKTGDSDGGDNTSFFGNNSAITARGGAEVTIDDSEITTAASGANGVFSYGGSATTNNAGSDGTTVTISNSKITTTGDNSGGIMTTGGGIMKARNLTINTSGRSSAAIRSDRGGGTVDVTGGSYTTTGPGSPAIYSTADITVRDADLVSKTSEGAIIEGANAITLENCTLTDNNDELNGQSTTFKNVFLYQSMSGDADNGQADFSATRCTITTNKGDDFYITNTTASIELSGNTIINKDSSGSFLRAQADSWGNSGSNGGDVTLKMINQKAAGNIVIDDISTLTMTMSDGSSYEGTINGENSAKSLSLTLDAGSSIKLTGDSYVSELKDADDTYSNIDFNGYTLYVAGNPIN